jgi:hypothetical protein
MDGSYSKSAVGCTSKYWDESRQIPDLEDNVQGNFEKIGAFSCFALCSIRRFTTMLSGAFAGRLQFERRDDILSCCAGTSASARRQCRALGVYGVGGCELALVTDFRHRKVGGQLEKLPRGLTGLD